MDNFLEIWQIYLVHHELFKNSKQWNWSLNCEKSCKESKKRLMAAELLVHFDANKDIVITCDASQYGVGAVMSYNGGQFRTSYYFLIKDISTRRKELFID